MLRVAPLTCAAAKRFRNHGADGETRTLTACATAPSRRRVYQFHHIRSVAKPTSVDARHSSSLAAGQQTKTYPLLCQAHNRGSAPASQPLSLIHDRGAPAGHLAPLTDLLAHELHCRCRYLLTRDSVAVPAV